MRTRLMILLAAAASAIGAVGACRDKAPSSTAAPAPPTASVTPAAPAVDPWTTGSAAKDPLKHPLFWKIEKDGKTTYLLGTMHLGVDPTTKIPDIVWEKLDASPTFAMETDLSQAAKLDVRRHDGTTLHQELGDAYWKKLEDALGADNAARMQELKPLVPAMELARLGLPETAPMDGVLQGRAINHHEKLVYLEPFETQATVLLKWMNAEALEDMLDDVPSVEQRSKDMLDAYLAGDEAKILAISDAERAAWKAHGHDEKKFDEEMEDLLFKRNASWITPIEKLHADGGGFIAVGTAHLVGPQSVLELLSKKGYVVTRIAQ